MGDQDIQDLVNFSVGINFEQVPFGVLVTGGTRSTFAVSLKSHNYLTSKVDVVT